MAGVVAALASCAVSPPRGNQNISQLVHISDNVASKQFDLELQNTTDHAWCIDEGSWPTSGGFLDAHSSDVSVQVNGRAFAIKERNLGFCPSSCDFRLGQGETVRGSIPYSEFSLPPEVEMAEKRLVLSIGSRVCR
jgi:hypothetical protein